MNKLRLFTLSIFAMPVFAQSPITILASDMAQIGNTINRKADTMTVITGPGPAGANQAWTMTTLSSYVINENTSVVTVASTPYASDFSNSNVSMTNDNVNYIYMNQQSATLTTQGGAGDLLMTGDVIVAPLNPDLLLHNFPRNYGATYTDNYATDITIDGSIISPLVNQVRYKRVGVVTDITDGWGTLTTPVGTYDVLRVKREDRAKDSIWVQAIFPPNWSLYSTKNDTAYSYQWLGKEMKLAVAELNYDSLDQPKTYKWTQTPPPTVSISEQAQVIQAEVFPVPASETISLKLGSELEAGEYFFTVYDVTGKMLLQERINGSASAVYTFSVLNLPQGLYSWQFVDRKQLLKGSGKLSVVR